MIQIVLQLEMKKTKSNTMLSKHSIYENVLPNAP